MSSSSSWSASGRSTINGNLNGRKQQLSSFVLFASVILFVNLCSFHQDFQYQDDSQELKLAMDGAKRLHSISYSFSENCLRFIKLMFTNPVRLGKRAVRYTQADAAMLGKMAKVWYIKKKIKKLGKKLKKHTIAVPVITAIPIYEHSYYPQQPHVAHHHMGIGHHAAASSFQPTFVAAAASSAGPAASPQANSLPVHLAAGQLATSASNHHQQAAPAYRMSAAAHQHPMFHPHHHHAGAGPSNQIINSYAPSPPLYVDEAGGLYGHYGNAYGRYDGGYQLW